MSEEGDARNCERFNNHSQAVDLMNNFTKVDGCDSDEELLRVLNVCCPTPEDEYTKLVAEIARQLSVIADKDASDYEKLQEKEKVLEFVVQALSAQSGELVAAVTALKKEAESRMVELDKYLGKTAHATKDMVVNLSNWGQEIKDLIAIKYQAEIALKQSHTKTSMLLTENSALRDQNANLLHDIQSLLKIIHQARATGNWEMECVTFCEIVPEDVYGPVCGMSFKQSHDSSDWADVVNGSTKPDLPEYTASENGSLSHFLSSDPCVQTSELRTSFEVQRLERKLVECQLEILEKDKIIADLESQVTSLNYEVTIKEADCEDHLSDLYWYQTITKGTYACPRSSLVSLPNCSMMDQRIKRPHLVDASTQADFRSAPRDQLCFTPYAGSCPSLHASAWESQHRLRKVQVNGTLDDADHNVPNLTGSTNKHSKHSVCWSGANSPVRGTELSKQSEVVSRDVSEEAGTFNTSLEQAQNSYVQTEERQTVDSATQTKQDSKALMIQQNKPVNVLTDAQGVILEARKKQHSSEFRASVAGREVSPRGPNLQVASSSHDMKNCAFQFTYDAGDSCEAWPSRATTECTILAELHGDTPHTPNYGGSFETSTLGSVEMHLSRRDSYSQTEFSNVAMAVQTDFKSEETPKGFKNQEVESLKERLSLMEEKVSSKDILLSQLHTHLETACKEVELKDKTLENIEKKLNASRQQCDAFKNDIVMLEQKAEELKKNVKVMEKLKHDMEVTIQTMKVTEHELHEQKRSLLVQLDSAAEESVKYKEEAELLRKQLAQRETEVRHQFATISNLQEALLDSKNALNSSRQQMLSTKIESYASNSQIHNI